MAQTVKASVCNEETWVRSLGWEDPLEKEMAAHSCILAWKIPWMVEPGGLLSMGSQRVRHDWATSLQFFTLEAVTICRSALTVLLLSHFSRVRLCATPSIDGSPPGCPVPGILEARTLEWVAISFSNAWKWKVKVRSLSHVRPSATPWTAAFQAPPSMGFSRQEY